MGHLLLAQLRQLEEYKKSFTNFFFVHRNFLALKITATALNQQLITHVAK
jgi:hypothetical protein